MKPKKTSSYVLDTSAILAFTEGEPGAEVVRNILRKTERGKARTFVSFMTFMEAFYRIWQLRGKESAEEIFVLLAALPMRRVDVDDDLIRLSGEIKALYRLSLADAWIIATALKEEALLVHKDPEFEQVKGRVDLFALPYKHG